MDDISIYFGPCLLACRRGARPLPAFGHLSFHRPDHKPEEMRIPGKAFNCKATPTVKSSGSLLA